MFIFSVWEGGRGQLSYWYTGTLASMQVKVPGRELLLIFLFYFVMVIFSVARDLPVRSLESKEKSVNYVFIDYLLFYGPLQRKLIQLVM